MIREKWPYILIVILLICGGFIYIQCQPPKTNVTLENQVSAKQTKAAPIENQKDEKDTKTNEPNPAEIVVDLKGAVNKPGVYHMTQGDRIVDVLDKAGGFTSRADKAQVNLAKKLTDEMMVYVPQMGEKLPDNLATSSGSATKDNAKININTATEQELEQIPGIGPSKASAIIEYREKNGMYQKVEDLDKVSGFGEKTVERMKDLITVQ